MSPGVGTSAVTRGNQLDVSLIERVTRGIPNSRWSAFQVQSANDAEDLISCSTPVDEVEGVHNTGVRTAG